MKLKWEIWVKNRTILEKDFKAYLKRETIREGATKIEIDGHLNKAKRNLRFSRSVIDNLKRSLSINLFLSNSSKRLCNSHDFNLLSIY